MSTERTSLLWDVSQTQARSRPALTDSPIQPFAKDIDDDYHTQFCTLVGCPPSNAPAGAKFRISSKSLYGRATEQLRAQNINYWVSASLSNTLLLLQVILGAAITALGASNSPPYVITIFGVLNTVIAGLVAYLKSRGQPMRARMFRDDLERLVDEIENSEIMWLGVSKGCSGYEDIRTEGYTVRSEVARLTRKYDAAVKNNTTNNPEMYSAGVSGGDGMGLRKPMAGVQPTMPAITLPAVVSGAGGNDNAAAAPAPAPAHVDDPDASPVSAPVKRKEEPKKEEPKQDNLTKTQSGSTPKTDGGAKSPDATKSGPSSPAATSSQAPADKTASTAAPSQNSTEPVAQIDPDASPASQPPPRKKSSSAVPTVSNAKS